MDFLCKKVISFQNEQNILPRFLRYLPKNYQSLAKRTRFGFSRHQTSGSYEALFSKKAQLYKSLGLKDKALTEADFKKYILEHYTFLSRPVFIINGAIYIGNSQQNILQVHKALS